MSTSEGAGWLTSQQARDCLLSVRPGEAQLAALSRLRKALSAEQARLIVEQWKLRERGLAKFTAAGQMFFTAQGLEQATDELVADYKAARFPAGEPVADLCSGVGGDLLGLAARGGVVACDRDNVLAAFAAWNVVADRQVRGRSSHPLEVRSSDVSDVPLEDCAAWHIDPDRRPSGRRTTKALLHEPSPTVIDGLLARNPNGAIKLAPAAELPAHWVERAQLEWISRAGQCRQLVAWFGQLAREPGRRQATVLGALGSGPRTVFHNPSAELPNARAIRSHVFEPDAAVLAAKLVATLAAEYQLSPIGAGSAYLTADRAIDDRALACFEVLEVMPYRVQPIKTWLRAHDVGQLEIKKRAVDLDPEKVRRQLAPRGSQRATLIVTTVGERVTAIMTRRLGVPA
ncbi:MAG TPA: hypothetical protein VL175_13825 [Pirellulales bacterium]|nr:hypothetical protein [Pirellulales bacterium]